MKWYQDSEGNTSSMRIMAMIATVTGAGVVIASMVALFLGIESTGIAGVGAALAVPGEIVKAWQANNGR